MLRIATRSKLLCALLACGTVMSITAFAGAAERCRCCKSNASGQAQPASSTGNAPAPIVHVDAMPISQAVVQSAGGYGPAPYGPGVAGPRGMGYGPVAASRAAKYAPNCRPQTYGNPDLFANYYVPPTCGGAGAGIYPAPYPVPALVGHTYYTYQPFAPHEMLYQHHRTYHRYYNGGRGLTRTKVKWSVGPLEAMKSGFEHFRLAR